MNERETWVEQPEHEIKTSEFQMQLGLASLTFEPGVALGRDEEVRSDHVRGPILLLSHPLATWITPQKKRRARLFHKFSIQTFQQSNLSCHFFFFGKNKPSFLAIKKSISKASPIISLPSCWDDNCWERRWSSAWITAEDLNLPFSLYDSEQIVWPFQLKFSPLKL